MVDKKLAPILGKEEYEQPMSPDLARAFVKDGIITQADLDKGLVASQHVEIVKAALASEEKHGK